jgi:hypothetical protein
MASSFPYPTCNEKISLRLERKMPGINANSPLNFGLFALQI